MREREKKPMHAYMRGLSEGMMFLATKEGRGL